MSYESRIADGLSRVRSGPLETVDFHAATARVVVFSDLHRGVRNKADDFRRSQPAMNAALAYYAELGYYLVMLGDIEELWEERAGPVLDSYAESYRLEAVFNRVGRYLRIFGNHDDFWAQRERVQASLVPKLGPLEVHEGALLRFDLDDGRRASLFVVHGHQGTRGSDSASWFSRIVVRTAWRSVQRLTHVSLNTPAKSLELQTKHNSAMYAWALANSRKNAGEVLVAGHTHKPVFLAQTRLASLAQQIGVDRDAAAAGDTAAAARLPQLVAEQAWIRGKADEADRFAELGSVPRQPVYFNSGCSCYADGSITGLEIGSGAIRLVRWPDDYYRPLPQELASVPLAALA